MNEIYKQRIAIIGAGNIGRMLLERLRRSGMMVRMAIYDTDAQKAQSAAVRVGAEAVTESDLNGCGATIWLLCPGPKAVLPFLRKFSSCLKPDHIVISFAAGVPLERLETLVPAGVHVVRVMPNMPSQIGRWMNPVCFSEKLPPEAREMVMQLLKALGEIVELRDDQMNWCVGLSGAAMRSLLPAIEGMIRAGQEAGISYKEAMQIAAKVMRGTADLVLQSDEMSLEEIKAVTPMETLDEEHLGHIFQEAAANAKAKVDRLQAIILNEMKGTRHELSNRLAF